MQNGNALYYLNEVGIYNQVIRNGRLTNNYQFSITYPRANKSAYEVYGKEITCNKSNLEGQRINVLKINDPITSDYRYYNYFDENGNKKTLPMGTIIYSHAGGDVGAIDHSWIYIGDLKTSNQEEAANKLVSMGIINENQKKWVVKHSESTHWRIESHGGAGVRITNFDPNMGDADGKKKTGTIWAFQVANDEITSGSYHLNLSKRSATDKLETLEDLQNYTTCIGGAKFNLKLYKNDVQDSNRNINIESNAGEMTRINWDNPEETRRNSSISIDNTNVIDKIIIEETEAPKNYNIPTIKKFELRIYKKINGNKYELYKVEAYKEDGTKLGEAVYEGNSARYFINKDNNIAIDMSNNAITITILNPEKEGEYSLEVEKIDAKTKKVIPGMVFTSQLEGYNTITATTGDNGKATLATQKVTKDNYEKTDHYIITENTSKKYATLAEALHLYVNKSEGTNNFIVSGISDTDTNFRDSITYNVKDTNGKDITCTATLNNGIISLVIENTPNEPPTFNLQKVDSEDNEKFLLDTNMTVRRKVVDSQDNTIVDYKNILDGKLKDVSSKYLEDGKTFTYTEEEFHAYPERYIYEIYENEAPEGYINILKGKMYVEVTVWCMPNFNATHQIRAIEGQDVTNEELAEARKNIKILNNYQAKKVTLVVKNPQEDIPFELNLYKHELNSDKAVRGIKFNVSKDGKNLNENGFTTQASAISLDKVSKANKGKTYTYIIEEENTNNNIVNIIEKAEVKVSVNQDGTISANISRIMKKGENSWQNYTDEFKNQVSIDGPDENNKITVKIANSMYYSVSLTKRDYETKEIVPGAKFTINQTAPKQKTILPNEENTDGAISNYTFIETEANSNSEYVYEISEVEVPENYLEMLKDVKIILHVKTDELGRIKPLSNSTNSSGTYYDFYKEGGLKTTEKNTLKQYIQLNVNTSSNSVSIDVYNKQEQHDYNIQIMKVDKKTKEPLPGAVFGVTYPDASSRSDVTTNNEGIANLYDKPRTFTNTSSDLYSIVELKEPDGANLLRNTRIFVTVDLHGVTNSKELSNANIKLDVSATAADGLTEIEGLEYQIVGNIIQIIIPNEMPEFKFNLNKQNLEDEYVDGIEFFVQEERPFMENKLYFQEIQNGKYSFTEIAMGNKTYTYLIKERCNILGYNNILDGIDLKVHVVTDANGRVKEIHENDENYTRLEIIDVSPYEGLTVDDVKDLFELQLGSETIDGKEVTTVNVTIKNPYKYKVRLEKQDIYGNVINDKVTLNAEKDGRTYRVNMNNNFTTTDVMIRPNETQEWTIRELNVEKPYYNILSGRYIKVITKWDSENKKIKAESLKIYTSDNTEVPANDEVYNYVKLKDIEIDDNTYIVPVVIINPFIYRMKVTKYESDGNTQLKGATITVNDKEIIGGTDGEESFYTEDKIANIEGIFEFKIKETKASENHINIFEQNDRYLTVGAKLTENGEIEILYNSVWEQKNGNSDPYLVNNYDEIYNYIEVTTGKDEDGIPVINVDILNPIEYIFEVNKTDTEKNPLNNALFEITSPVVKAQSGKYIEYSEKFNVNNVSATGNINGTTNNEGIISYEEKCAKIGEEYEYKIVEKRLWNYAITPIPSDYSIYVKVTVNMDGSISLGTYESGKNYIVKDNQENIVTNYDDLITVLVERSGKKPVVKVNIQNPVRFNLVLNKKLFGEEGASLSGRTFKITNATTGRTENLTSGTDGLLGIKEVEMRAGTYKYIITEETTKDDNAIINTLEGKAIVLNVKVNGNGSVSIIKDNEVDTTNGLYVYNYANNQLGDKIPLTDKVYEFVSVEDIYYGPTTNQYTDTGVATVDLTVINPEEYEIMLYKEDKDTNEKMNNIKFSVSVYDSEGKEIKLKDSRTFSDKNLDEVLTSNVDGHDGVIKIDNILFEKTGLYTIKLHEINTPEGYKNAEDIELEVSIIIANGRYIINNLNIKSGEYFVDENNTTIADDEQKSVISIKIENEQIKGVYSLDFIKINEKSEELEGAKIKVTAWKDGKEINLYKSDDNVEPKNIIIPGEFEIKKGSIEIPDIKIEEAGSYIVRIEEIKNPDKYVGLDNTVDIEITTTLVGTGRNQMYNFDSAEIVAGNEKGLVEINSEPGRWFISIRNEQFDLALRKFITQIEHEGKNTETTNREPKVDVSPLRDGTDTTAIYNHTKEPIRLYAKDTVIYKIRVYNEADIDGYAEEVTDHLPEYLEFVNDEFNSKYGWILDESDKSLRTIRTNYLSKARDEKGNLIKAFNKETGELDYKELEIKCRVKENVPANLKLTNIAEISKYIGKDGKKVVDRDSSEGNVQLPEDSNLPSYKDKEISSKIEYIPGEQDDDDFEKVLIEEFDLALRKFITGVTNGHGEKQEITTREPVFKIENGKYVYDHNKEPVVVANQNIVEYTIRVYNEGTVNGYAKEIKDDIPEGLEFLPDDELNREYRWIMLDEEGNETDEVNKAKYIVTDYLSKENEKIAGENLLKSFDKSSYEAGSIKEPDYKEVKVAFKVIMPNTSDEIIINKAQISDDSDENGNEVTDKDSIPNEWNEGEDDQDIEKIKVQYFDLALRKWVTKAIVIEDGKETVYNTGHKAEDDPEAVVKVDLKNSKIDKVVVKFEYQIRITNEGEIAGSVEEISDYIPEGLKFVAADNVGWKEDGGKVITNSLAGQIIEPGESKEVTILLTWINGKDNMGLKVNVAEISKDYNEYGSPDIDSTPNNKVPGEDDIDDAPVMLTVTTGEAVIYVGITIAVLAILAGGIIGIKKYVIK